MFKNGLLHVCHELSMNSIYVILVDHGDEDF